MDNQIESLLLTLRKISNLPENPYIDTTDGDIDVYQPGVVNYVKHVTLDGRKKMRDLLKQKYDDTRIMLLTIAESRKNIDRLDTFRGLLETSAAGLRKICTSKHYKNDMRVFNSIEHILRVVIPYECAIIDGVKCDAQRT